MYVRNPRAMRFRREVRMQARAWRPESADRDCRIGEILAETAG